MTGLDSTFRVLMVASEAVPFAKSGGLADVIGSLPPALAEGGQQVAVVLPRYGSISVAGAQRAAEGLGIWLGATSYRVDIYVTAERDVRFFLVDCPRLYDRDGLYTAGGRDYPDNPERFGLLCRAALEVARRLFRPQILHCHDWQAALVAPYLRHMFAGDPTFFGMKILLTIHNLGYQGRFGQDAMDRVGLDGGQRARDVLKFAGGVNFLKAGIQLADALTTVSPTYAREIQTREYGFGLEALLRSRKDVLTGILNGVDYTEWNPETDPHLAANYTADELEGKQQCKRDLLREFGLPEEEDRRPVIGIVSRFVAQKGFDLIEEAAGALAAEELFLVALGTGEARYEELFRKLAAANPGKIAVRVAYDERLAHKIEAGADMFLMPSRYEPCGLNQIYSLRYGTVPIVRATGGLEDTVDAATGFKFREYTPEALLEAMHAALAAYRDRERWERMMRAGMAKDYSWKRSAGEYAALYRRLLE